MPHVDDEYRWREEQRQDESEYQAAVRHDPAYDLPLPPVLTEQQRTRLWAVQRKIGSAYEHAWRIGSNRDPLATRCWIVTGTSAGPYGSPKSQGWAKSNALQGHRLRERAAGINLFPIRPLP